MDEKGRNKMTPLHYAARSVCRLPSACFPLTFLNPQIWKGGQGVGAVPL